MFIVGILQRGYWSSEKRTFGKIEETLYHRITRFDGNEEPKHKSR
jgi:hypothetical protein